MQIMPTRMAIKPVIVSEDTDVMILSRILWEDKLPPVSEIWHSELDKVQHQSVALLSSLEMTYVMLL